MSSTTVAKVVSGAQRVMPVSSKYTVQSTGIWERIRRALAIAPERSNGVPLKQYRNPPPGSNEPFSFEDPVTLPAGDIAGNPYWKRDSRRSYPQLSFVTQGDVVGLLSLGSKSAPKKELIGEEGSKHLVSVKEVGEKGLASYFETSGKEAALARLGRDGLPPLPSGMSLKKGQDKYSLTAENAYPAEYPCRTFQ
ncbi:probable NADH dehydrogenase (ubiquinone) 29/21K chain precursor [Rhynchosporium secalis]|uniref:Probable NADH dehydrogenase (Ubiquinone) 29/21K chain n=1 Tax=Rhynchosporium secalis TaxID=38038 RepID=A0A1E1M7Y7_RHYSE|nr:probable NADH dehydrogenase (ubiquinone) 29/21K chain precursor [Rhynchosporium secalis]